MADPLTETIRQLEAQLLSATVRASAEALAALIADDFCEVGASGRTYTKEEVLAALPQEQGARIDMEDFQLRTLAEGVVLATYRAIRHDDALPAPAISLRSSVWQQQQGTWRMVFHQGTAVGARVPRCSAAPPSG